jgi:hypothetical protein
LDSRFRVPAHLPPPIGIGAAADDDICRHPSRASVEEGESWRAFDFRFYYQSIADFEDMSPWAVHFARDSSSPLDPKGEPSGYQTVMSILYDGHIRAVNEPHGMAAGIPELAAINRPACFSEVPLHLLDRIVRNRSEYGVGFSQRLLRSKGGGRLWYVEDDGEPAAAISELVDQHRGSGVDPEDPLWKITPFIELATTTTAFGDYLWEREWRVPGGLLFDPSDVEFLFIPETLHNQARQFFTDVKVEHSGPAYLCPYIDVNWDRDKIEARLNEAPAAVEPSPSAVAARLGPDWF